MTSPPLAVSADLFQICGDIMIITNKILCRTYQAFFGTSLKFFNWRKPEIFSGIGSIKYIPEILNSAGVSRPIIVTDSHLSKLLFPKTAEILDSAKIAYSLYSGVVPNPTEAVCQAIKEQYIKDGCDSFIALGGGSSIDASKGAAALVVRPDKTIGQLRGLLKVHRNLPPFIAIPTTAGTGSEVTVAAVITDETDKIKSAIMDMHLVPKYAVLDPQLTVGLPPDSTAYTGMDALTHAVEAYLCRRYSTPETEQYCEYAVENIFKNLERAYSDGSDIQARQALLTSSFKAGFAFTRAGVTYVHAIAHAIGGLYDMPHGFLNAVILPIALKDYGDTAVPFLAKLGSIIGIAGSTNKEKASNFIAAIENLNRSLNIPPALDGIRREDIPEITRRALKEANPLYAVPVIYDFNRLEALIEKIRTPDNSLLREASI